MIDVWPCQVEVLFGSRYRRDHDTLSDIDYLIADDDSRVLAARKDRLNRSGFSVSDYSMRRLRKLFQRRTLFSVHLKLESRVIFDRNGEFHSLLADLKPHRDYSVEQEEAQRLFRPLELVPSNELGAMWALDHLAVAFRNASIVHFAQRGEFIFAQDAIIAAHRRDGTLSCDDVELLQRVRVAKHLYRRGQTLENAVDLSQRALRAVDHIFHLGIHTQFTSQPCEARIAAATSSTDAYIELREIERELVSIDPLSISPEAQKTRAEVLRTVRDPHNYLWRAMYAPGEFARSMAEVRAGCC